jgi:hypothetical protein
VLPTGAPESGRDLGGHANTNAELVSAARAQIAELGKDSPGTSPSSRRARREAIGLPRFGDPEDLKAVADSARSVGAPLGAYHQQQVPGAYCRRSPPLQVPASSAGIQASCAASMLRPLLWLGPGLSVTRTQVASSSPS